MCLNFWDFPSVLFSWLPAGIVLLSPSFSAHEVEMSLKQKVCWGEQFYKGSELFLILMLSPVTLCCWFGLCSHGKTTQLERKCRESWIGRLVMCDYQKRRILKAHHKTQLWGNLKTLVVMIFKALIAESLDIPQFVKGSVIPVVWDLEVSSSLAYSLTVSLQGCYFCGTENVLKLLI